MAAKTLRWFACLWLWGVGGLIAASYVSICYTEGFGKVQELLSPFNVVNFLATVVALSPGIGAYLLAERLEERRSAKAAAGSSNESPALAAAESLVRSYGATLEAAAAAKSLATDSDRLPAPKDQIKAALLTVIRATPDSRTREQLKVGYLELASFQPGVGSAPIGFHLPDVPGASDSEAIRATAQSIVERGPEVQRWTAITSREREVLVEELRRAGFWDTAAEGHAD